MEGKKKKQSVYVSDNFFSTGTAEIYNELKEKIREVDLKSEFTAGVGVLNQSGEIIVSGKFSFFSRKWIISTAGEKEIGKLKAKFAYSQKDMNTTPTVTVVIVLYLTFI